MYICKLSLLYNKNNNFCKDDDNATCTLQTSLLQSAVDFACKITHTKKTLIFTPTIEPVYGSQCIRQPPPHYSYLVQAQPPYITTY